MRNILNKSKLKFKSEIFASMMIAGFMVNSEAWADKLVFSLKDVILDMGHTESFADSISDDNSIELSVDYNPGDTKHGKPAEYLTELYYRTKNINSLQEQDRKTFELYYKNVESGYNIYFTNNSVDSAFFKSLHEIVKKSVQDAGISGFKTATDAQKNKLTELLKKEIDCEEISFEKQGNIVITCNGYKIIIHTKKIDRKKFIFDIKPIKGTPTSNLENVETNDLQDSAFFELNPTGTVSDEMLLKDIFYKYIHNQKLSADGGTFVINKKDMEKFAKACKKLCDRKKRFWVKKLPDGSISDKKAKQNVKLLPGVFKINLDHNYTSQGSSYTKNAVLRIEGVSESAAKQYGQTEAGVVFQIFKQ